MPVDSDVTCAVRDFPRLLAPAHLPPARRRSQSAAFRAASPRGQARLVQECTSGSRSESLPLPVAPRSAHGRPGPPFVPVDSDVTCAVRDFPRLLAPAHLPPARRRSQSAAFRAASPRGQARLGREDTSTMGIPVRGPVNWERHGSSTTATDANEAETEAKARAGYSRDRRAAAENGADPRHPEAAPPFTRCTARAAGGSTRPMGRGSPGRAVSLGGLTRRMKDVRIPWLTRYRPAPETFWRTGGG